MSGELRGSFLFCKIFILRYIAQSLVVIAVFKIKKTCRNNVLFLIYLLLTKMLFKKSYIMLLCHASHNFLHLSLKLLLSAGQNISSKKWRIPKPRRISSMYENKRKKEILVTFWYFHIFWFVVKYWGIEVLYLTFLWKKTMSKFWKLMQFVSFTLK